MLTEAVVNVALIGCGNIGSKRAAAVAAHPASRLSLVVDTDATRAEALTRRYGCACATDWRAVLDSEAQVVIVSVPTPQVHEIVLPLLDAGRHVLCEKPLGRDLSQARQITQRAQARGVVLETGLNLRFDSALRQAWELVTSGQLGTLYFLKCDYVNGAVLTNTNEVGSLLDVGVHSLDLVLWFLGGVETVLADLQAHEHPVDDNGFIVLRQGSVLAVVHFSFVRWRNQFRFEASGSRGYVLVESLPKWGTQRLTVGRRVLPSGPPEEITQTFSEDLSWHGQWEHMVRCVTQGQAPRDRDIGLRSMALAALVRESARRATAVVVRSPLGETLDLQAEQQPQGAQKQL